MAIRAALTTAGLLLASLLAAVPAANAQCGGAVDERCTYPEPSDGPVNPGGLVDCAAFEPGEPGGGVLGLTEWYAAATANSTCALGKAAQDTGLQGGGDLAWTVAGAAVAGAGLVNASGVADGLPAYQASLEAVAASEAHDACFALFGPLCGDDTAVDQAQRCPAGLAVPQLIPGGLVGDTLANANAAMQATCLAASGTNSTVPGEGEGAAYLNATQAAVVEQVAGVGPASGAVAGAVLRYGNETLANLCIYLTESTPCFFGETGDFAFETIGWNLEQAENLANGTLAFAPIFLAQELQAVNATKNMVCNTDAALGSDPPGTSNLNSCGGLADVAIQSAEEVYTGTRGLLETVDPSLASQLPPSLVPEEQG